MSKFTNFIWLTIPALIIFSCADNDEVQKTRQDIFPLKEGNYWIYKTIITSSDGVVSVFPYLDSVWIEGKIRMDDVEYWMQKGTLSGEKYLRDSADCVLIRQLDFEQIIYSTNRDTLTVRNPVYKIITDINATTLVPAGEFKTINCRTLLRKEPSNSGHGAEYPSFDNKFYTAEQYLSSENTGLVKNVYYYLGGTVEYELLRFKLN
jgi:hypothetical protein